jgi:hypothetical protein
VRKILTIFAVGLLIFPIIANAGPKVLVLGDGGSEVRIIEHLESLNYTMSEESTDYWDWDGSIEEGTQAIVYLTGDEAGSGLGSDHSVSTQTAANNAIIEFVSGGGGLILTEWMAHNLAEEGQDEAVGDLLPVTYDGDWYRRNPKWKVADGFDDHALVDEISDLTETDGSGFAYNFREVKGDGYIGMYSKVIAKDDLTTVVMEDKYGTPLLSYRTDAGGVVVHINDGMAYDWEISENMLGVVGNAVAFAILAEPSSLILLAFGMLILLWRRNAQKKVRAFSIA